MTRTSSSLFVLCALVGCADTDSLNAEQDDDGGPQIVTTTDSKLLRVEAYTSPDQPPTRGVSNVTLLITDAKTGEPQKGLVLEAVPWMPAHAHGTSMKTEVDAWEPGVYEISKVNMYMGGLWDLRVALTGTKTDHVTLHFEIR